MSKKTGQNLLVGLDVGTSKVACVIAELEEVSTENAGAKTNLNIIGVGSVPSLGLKQGDVVNIEDTVRSIQGALDQAKAAADCNVYSVFTTISGKEIKSQDSHGSVGIRDLEVTQADVERVLDAARSVPIPPDHQLLHILTQEFIIDGKEVGVRQPVGMSGVRLEVNVHVVHGPGTSAQNIAKCITRCGVKVEDMLLEQLAASHAVLSDDEKKLGVCLVGMGGGVTTVAIFHGGALRYTALIPVAGGHVTNDLAVAFRLSTQLAEQIKLNYGIAAGDSGNASKRIKLSNDDGEPFELNQGAITRVIEPRYEEILSYVLQVVYQSGYLDAIPFGLVFTGGAVKVAHFTDLAKRIFNKPVRIGYPRGVSGSEEMLSLLKDPAYASVVGLLHYAKLQQEQGVNKQRRPLVGGSDSFVGRLRNWFHAHF